MTERYNDEIHLDLERFPTGQEIGLEGNLGFGLTEEEINQRIGLPLRVLGSILSVLSHRLGMDS